MSVKLIIFSSLGIVVIVVLFVLWVVSIIKSDKKKYYTPQGNWTPLDALDRYFDSRRDTRPTLPEGYEAKDWLSRRLYK